MRPAIHRAACALLLLLTTIVIPATATAFSLEEWQAEVAREDSMEGLGRLFIFYLLETDPAYGLQVGIHGKGDDTWYYDRRLGGTSPAAWQERYRALLVMRDRLAEMDTGAMSFAERVDYRILDNEVRLRILEITRLGASTDPLTYVSGRANAMSGLGGTFSGLLLRDYGPLAERLASFGARCAETGPFLAGARASLLPPYVQPPAAEKQLTLTRLAGLTAEDGLFRKSLPEVLAKAGLEPDKAAEIRSACDAAVAEIIDFAAWFEADIVPRPDGDWRLGPALYAAKYEHYMDYPLGPEALLAAAEADLAEVRAGMVATARRIHDGFLADAIAAGKVRPAAGLSDQQVVENVFTLIAEDRSTVDTLIEDSYAMADAIVGFVREHDLIDLPPTSKMRIEDIPPYLSGYAVAQIYTAPPFEPDLQSVWFWDLNLLRDSESFLKEYNRPTLAMVYMHEGVPGHFVQLEYSNRAERVIPKVFYNGAMVEGWATYIQTQLVDQGFTIYPGRAYGHEIQQLVDDKLILRSIINAIIDIRLHTTDWSEEAAVAMMMEQGFQEEGEARGKLTRAKLSSVQLASYYAGYRAIRELLAEYRAKQGEDFSWKAFNQDLLGAGSPPFFAIRARMLGEAD